MIARFIGIAAVAALSGALLYSNFPATRDMRRVNDFMNEGAAALLTGADARDPEIAALVWVIEQDRAVWSSRIQETAAWMRANKLGFFYNQPSLHEVATFYDHHHLSDVVITPSPSSPGLCRLQSPTAHDLGKGLYPITRADHVVIGFALVATYQTPVVRGFMWCNEGQPDHLYISDRSGEAKNRINYQHGLRVAKTNRPQAY